MHLCGGGTNGLDWGVRKPGPAPCAANAQSQEVLRAEACGRGGARVWGLHLARSSRTGTGPVLTLTSCSVLSFPGRVPGSPTWAMNTSSCSCAWGMVRRASSVSRSPGQARRWSEVPRAKRTSISPTRKRTFTPVGGHLSGAGVPPPALTDPFTSATLRKQLGASIALAILEPWQGRPRCGKTGRVFGAGSAKLFLGPRQHPMGVPFLPMLRKLLLQER